MLRQATKGVKARLFIGASVLFKSKCSDRANATAVSFLPIVLGATSQADNFTNVSIRISVSHLLKMLLHSNYYLVYTED